MPRFKRCISSVGVGIELRIEGSHEFVNSVLSNPFWREFVPGFGTTQHALVDETWQLIEANSLDYNYALHRIHTPERDIKRAIVILESAFERLRQNRLFFTMHGSVMARDGRAVGLIGNLSGIGKTKLTAYARNNGWEWIADEKFTISAGNIVGGCELLADEKTALAAGGHKPFFEAPVPLALIAQAIVTNEPVTTRHDLSAERAQWALYDEMTRDIRCVNGIIAPPLPALESQDSQVLAQSRLAYVEKLSSTVRVSHLRGNEPSLLAEIDKIIDKR